MELDAEYSPEEVRWTATAGAPAGSTGLNATHSLEVAPGVYFVNWPEESGTSVSQVLDVNVLRITAFVTFDAPGGRGSAYQAGTLRVE